MSSTPIPLATVRRLEGFLGPLTHVPRAPPSRSDWERAHIYLGGYVGGADLERITSSGRAYILVERSDLAVGKHVRTDSRITIEVLAN